MMPNLNFTLSGRSDGGLNQAWEITSAHTGVVIGNVHWRAAWSMYSFEPVAQGLDASALREIAKFLDEQMEIRSQDKQLR
jgi:hypothetical protein